MPGESQMAEAVVAAEMVATKGRFRRFCGFIGGCCWYCVRKAREWTPFMAYFIVLYVGLAFMEVDLRREVFSLGAFVVTGVDILYPLTGALFLTELLRVTHPGVDNSTQCNFMLGTLIVSVILFTLGVAGIPQLALLVRTEFAMLLFLAAVQLPIANKLNSRTATRGMSLDSHN